MQKRNNLKRNLFHYGFFLKHVPMNMFSWEGLSFITSAAGHPVPLHSETAACSNFDVAKVFINADLSKELPKKD